MFMMPKETAKEAEDIDDPGEVIKNKKKETVSKRRNYHIL